MAASTNKDIIIKEVAPRIETIEIFGILVGILKLDLFCELDNEKTFFFLWTKETTFFPYFYHEIISTALSYLTSQST